MTIQETRARKPLRVWPVITIAIAYAAIAIASFFVDMELPAGLLGGVVAALLILIWWLTISRSRWQERLGVLPLMAATVLLVRFTAHQSIYGGAQLMMSYILGVVCACFALGAWALVADRFSGTARWAVLVASLLLIGWLPVAAIRTEGVKGGSFVMHWRWTPTPEELLLAQGPSH